MVPSNLLLCITDVKLLANVPTVLGNKKVPTKRKRIPPTREVSSGFDICLAIVNKDFHGHKKGKRESDFEGLLFLPEIL